MKQKAKYIVPVIIIVLLIGVIFSVIHMNNKYDVIESYQEVKDEAVRLHENGDIEGAIEKMKAYCTYVVTDVEARALLGDWYYESGDEENAYACYYKAADNKQAQTEKIASLSVKNTQEILLEPIDTVRLEIAPDVRMTKDMTLKITGQNIVPVERHVGKIEVGEARLTSDENYYTTEWFDVDPDGEYLTMSGGFNYAIWQFRDEAGVIIVTAKSPNYYRLNDTYSINVYQMARAVIPEDAFQCRVTYFDKSRESVTASPDEQLTIVYGRLPGESKQSNLSSYDIPDLKEGEKIVYDENGWKMVTADGEKKLEDWVLPTIERGSYFSISGTLPGRISFEGSTYSDYSKDGIYTIRFDADESSAMGERMDDAKNLSFNSAVGSGSITLGENHFDSVYPWKDIKLCTINDGKVTYSGEKGFMTNGDSGDVFVEIPKFYVRRTIDERYDTISISGTKHEGFEVDPAFITQNGEADKIYIAAYLTGKNEEGELVSASGIVPMVNMSAEEIKKNTEAKGDGYKEVDYAVINAIQKLFMVETGLRNSQYLYTGVCAYSIASEDLENAIIALNSKENTNCIDVDNVDSFIEGNSVVIYNSAEYAKGGKYPSDMREIKTIVDNKDGTYSVYFTGDPRDVTAGETAIAHVAVKNGGTKGIDGHTGAVSTARGTVSFKYRNIENLWGNAYVYVDNVTVTDARASVTDRKGNMYTMAYDLPVTNDRDLTECMVRRVGYDPQNPLVLLPCEVGSDATISTYYGDAYYGKTDGGEYVLHYGGGWNSLACAGLFSYRAVAKSDEVYPDTTGRMMYVK